MAATTFLLVHGAFHGGWCWGRVAERLRAHGHVVYAPTLTGLAERSEQPGREITLSTHVADIVDLIDREDLRNIVLCGHSYGGMVVSGVVEQRRGAIRAIVYLDAFLPADGDSVASLTPIGVVMPQLLARGICAIPPFTAEQFAVNVDDRAWVDSQCTDQPIGTFAESIAITGAREAIASKVYVRAQGYPAPWFDAALETTRLETSWVTEMLACGHDAMIDCPDEVTTILERA